MNTNANDRAEKETAEVKPSHLRLYNICFSVCFTLALLGAIELGAALTLRMWNPANRGQFDRGGLRVYQQAAWGRKYWEEESAASHFSYESYVGWRQLPFAGQMINIDRDRHRTTINSHCEGNSPTIWMFGGSTMWGTGSPDWATIPSDLARLSNDAGKPACVINYGQTGWRNTQELIELELELKRNPRRPALVVFYDGFNDGYSFYQSGRVDVHMNYDSIRERIEKQSSRRTLSGALIDLFLSTHAARLIMHARPSRSFIDAEGEVAHTDTGGAEADLEISYLRNLQVVEALSREYGFQYAFFWQPLIFAGHKPLTADEERIKNFYRGRLDERDEEYRAMSAVLKQRKPEHLIDITNAFDGVTDDVYVDCVHVAPTGNELVAQRMHRELLKIGWSGSTDGQQRSK